MRLIGGFASGLGALKAKSELREGVTLTADEVDGIIWAIQQLRGGAEHDAARQPAQR